MVDIGNIIDTSPVLNDKTIWGDHDTWTDIVPDGERLTILSTLQNIPDDIGDMIGRQIVQRTICRKLNKVGRQLAWRFMGGGQAPSPSVLQAASKSYDNKVSCNIRFGNQNWLCFHPDPTYFQGSLSRNFQTLTMEGKRFRYAMEQLKGRKKEAVVRRKQLREGILQTIVDYILYGEHDTIDDWRLPLRRVADLWGQREYNIRSLIGILSLNKFFTSKTLKLFSATHFTLQRK